MHSQYEQDQLLEQHLFKGMRGGTFLDVGAHDGIALSNTRFFESERGWRGICIEANPTVYEQLLRNRPDARCLLMAAAATPGTLQFTKVNGPSEMLSGLTSSVDVARIEREVLLHGGAVETIAVDAKPLTAILLDCGVRQLDYLSMDIEGGEEQALDGLDFDIVQVDVMTIECNSPQSLKRVRQRLPKFAFLGQHGSDAFFVRRGGRFAPAASSLRAELKRRSARPLLVLLGDTIEQARQFLYKLKQSALGQKDKR